MPTILYLKGWRFYLFSNEGNEPPHVHVVKAEREGEFWLDADRYDVTEAFTHKMSPSELRFVRKTIFDHFEEFLDAWNDFQRERRHD